jgi:hypothetical protein
MSRKRDRELGLNRSISRRDFLNGVTSSPARPAVRGRRPLGRVAIANSDAAASPHTDAAIDEAYRAVMEISSASDS